MLRRGGDLDLTYLNDTAYTVDISVFPGGQFDSFDRCCVGLVTNLQTGEAKCCAVRPSEKLSAKPVDPM